ncbi:right-handed parallel beta-helix repeat-containing protein [Sphingobium sp. AN558]|uniref:right-handed parallel beta-helix repeat-containing protein n=1 Tax=Sphingobium sp. AN558 TaxID=3133442 RepID=UPI0030BAD74B
MVTAFIAHFLAGSIRCEGGCLEPQNISPAKMQARPHYIRPLDRAIVISKANKKTGADRIPETSEGKMSIKKILASAVAACLLQLFALAGPAHAQATRTWVSGVGDDVNPCSRTAPCKTFAGAISKTATGGEINTLDPGAFGAVTITKSITIRSDHMQAGVLATLGSNGININAPSAKVILDGLDIEGASTGGTGIRVLSALDVIVKNCDIRNFTTGISVNTTAQARVTVDRSMIGGNVDGITITSTPGFGHVKLFNSLLINNTSSGVSVSGANNDVFIHNNQILGSTKSLNITSGGLVRSFGTNIIPTGDAPTSTTPLL